MPQTDNNTLSMIIHVSIMPSYIIELWKIIREPIAVDIKRWKKHVLKIACDNHFDDLQFITDI